MFDRRIVILRFRWEINDSGRRADRSSSARNAITILDYDGVISPSHGENEVRSWNNVRL